MARSEYIYLVSWSGVPFGAFTVKHELRTWLERQDKPGDYVLYRLRDGDPGGQAAEMSVFDVMAGR